jgi:hypothetical protein
MIILTLKIKWQNRAFGQKYSAGEFTDVCNGHRRRRAGKLKHQRIVGLKHGIEGTRAGPVLLQYIQHTCWLQLSKEPYRK